VAYFKVPPAFVYRDIETRLKSSAWINNPPLSFDLNDSLLSLSPDLALFAANFFYGGKKRPPDEEGSCGYVEQVWGIGVRLTTPHFRGTSFGNYYDDNHDYRATIKLAHAILKLAASEQEPKCNHTATVH
jgi:hypothetical protein